MGMKRFSWTHASGSPGYEVALIGSAVRRPQIMYC